MALATGAVALVIGPIGAALAATDPSGRVATVSQGWWNQTAAPLAAPANPLTGLVTIPTAPASDVPDGVLPVTMRLGQATRVAAIGMTFDAPTGTQVNRLVLRLSEADAELAQQGSGAGVRACPITDFLVTEENGEAANTPTADCDVAQAEGERGDDGTWTFDLTSIGQAWASGAVTVNGIRLDPVGDPPATFQVGFAGLDDAVVEADLVLGAGGEDPFGDLTPASTDDFGVGSVTESATTLTDPGPVAAPVAAPKAASPRRTVPIAAQTPGSSFIGSALATALVLLGLAVLGLATMLELGAPVEPVSSAAIRRVSRPVGPRSGLGVRRA
jgi:hypothetical protein